MVEHTIKLTKIQVAVLYEKHFRDSNYCGKYYMELSLPTYGDSTINKMLYDAKYELYELGIINRYDVSSGGWYLTGIGKEFYKLTSEILCDIPYIEKFLDYKYKDEK